MKKINSTILKKIVSLKLKMKNNNVLILCRFLRTDFLGFVVCLLVVSFYNVSTAYSPALFGCLLSIMLSEHVKLLRRMSLPVFAFRCFSVFSFHDFRTDFLFTGWISYIRDLFRIRNPLLDPYWLMSFNLCFLNHPSTEFGNNSSTLLFSTPVDFFSFILQYHMVFVSLTP